MENISLGMQLSAQEQARDALNRIWFASSRALELEPTSLEYEMLQTHANEIIAFSSLLNPSGILTNSVANAIASENGRIEQACMALTSIHRSAAEGLHLLARVRRQPDLVAQGMSLSDQLDPHARSIAEQADVLKFVLGLDDSELSSSSYQRTSTTQANGLVSASAGGSSAALPRSAASAGAVESHHVHQVSDTPAKQGCQGARSVASQESGLPGQGSLGHGSQDLQGLDDVLARFEGLPTESGSQDLQGFEGDGTSGHPVDMSDLGRELKDHVGKLCEAETRGSYIDTVDAMFEVRLVLETLIAKPDATKRTVLDGFLQEFGFVG